MTQAEDSQIFEVIIVGAGPIGLATAIGLHQRGITNLLVIEKARQFEKVGAGLDLLPNGLKALKFLDPSAYEKVKETGKTKSSDWDYKDLKGRKIRSMSQDFDHWLNKYGEGRISIGWFDLQTVLREYLPADKVLANHCCTNITKLSELDCLKIDVKCNIKSEKNIYAHWKEYPIDSSDIDKNSLTKSFFAKIVIGADGINSTVRKILYKNNYLYEPYAKPEYSGFSGIFCLNSNECDENISKEIRESFLENASLVTIRKNNILVSSQPIEEPRMLLFQTDNNKFGCMLQGAFEEEIILNKNGNDLIEILKNTLLNAGFPNCLIEVINQTIPDFMQKRIYYMHRAVISKELSLPTTSKSERSNNITTTEVTPPWFGERIVLAGDAAHGMPPFSGQGTNQGLEDAAVITNLIAGIKNQLNNEEAIESAFEKYDRLRRPLIIKLQQASLGPYSYWSDDELNKYNQEIYCRNFEEILENVNK